MVECCFYYWEGAATCRSHCWKGKQDGQTQCSCIHFYFIIFIFKIYVSIFIIFFLLKYWLHQVEKKDFQKQTEILICCLGLLLNQCFACFSRKVHNFATSYFPLYQQDSSVIMGVFIHSCRRNSGMNNPYSWGFKRTQRSWAESTPRNSSSGRLRLAVQLSANNS